MDKDIFSQERLESLFPATRANAFFDALFGDAEEGAYDIALEYCGQSDDWYDFRLCLTQRPGKCLACNLTYGLPQVFAKHPIIDIQGVADEVAHSVGKKTATWELGATQEISHLVHAIPLRIHVK